MAIINSSGHKLWKIYRESIHKIMKGKAERTLGTREIKRSIVEYYLQIYTYEI